MPNVRVNSPSSSASKTEAEPRVSIDHLRAILAEIYGNELPFNGETDEALNLAESRLGFPLPKLLRQYYQLASHTDRANSALHRLIGPANLQVRSRALDWSVSIESSQLKFSFAK